MNEQKGKLIVESIVYELVKEKIPVELTLIELENTEVIGYVISGFSKSGTATLYYDSERDNQRCISRYGRTVEINSFEDLSDEAWYWYISYRDREPFTEPNEYWTPIWVEEGKLIPVTTYTTKFERSL